MPQNAKKCIDSWRKFLPDYEVKEWNESNFDVRSNAYIEEAYRLRKYAFVSDYARFWVLYKYGGIYFDTDVEVIKSIDDIIARGPFMGLEDLRGSGKDFLAVAPGLGLGCNPGLGLGCNPGLGLMKKILDYYNNHFFIQWNGRMSETVVYITSKIIIDSGLVPCESGIYQCEDFYIYAYDYFDPMNYQTRKIEITDNTRTIHHYAASWVSNSKSMREKIKMKLRFLWVHYNVLVRHKIFARW